MVVGLQECGKCHLNETKHEINKDILCLFLFFKPHKENPSKKKILMLVDMVDG